MAHVLIKYSVPIHSQQATLDGSAGTDVVGWENVAVSIRTNHVAAFATSGIYYPNGYYITDTPSVTLNPPHTGLCDVITVSRCYSRTPKSASLVRLGGSRSGVV